MGRVAAIFQLYVCRRHRGRFFRSGWEGIREAAPWDMQMDEIYMGRGEGVGRGLLANCRRRADRYSEGTTAAWMRKALGGAMGMFTRMVLL